MNSSKGRRDIFLFSSSKTVFVEIEKCYILFGLTTSQQTNHLPSHLVRCLVLCFIDTQCDTCVNGNDHIKCVVSLIQFTIRCSDSYQTNRPMALLLLTNEVHRAYQMAATLERIKGERTCDADDKVVTKHVPDMFDEVCGVAETIFWHLPLTAVGRSICDMVTQQCHGTLSDTAMA